MKAKNGLVLLTKGNTYNYIDLLSELKVHCVNLHDVESADECDKLVKLIKTMPKAHHKKILKKYIGRIVPKSNVVYRFSPKETNDWNNISRFSKKRMNQDY
jgi:hypothetical protein